MDPQIIAVVPHRARPGMTAKCLDSMGEADFIETIDNYNLYDHFNIHQMWNLGLDRIATSTEAHVLIANNDVVYDPGAITEMARMLIDYPDIGVICINTDGMDETSDWKECDRVAGARIGEFAGWSFMFRASAGIRFPAWLCWWGGDNWMMKTFQDRGYKVGMARRATGTHFTSSTINKFKDDKRFQDTLALDVKLMQKWVNTSLAPSEQQPRFGRYGDGSS